MHDVASPDSPPTGVRARARAALLADVADVARRHLAEAGAAALSVRAIARELGLASSALYRYYPSRDHLLTQLIIESYDALGQAVEDADAAVTRHDLSGRYRAACHGVRDWALAHPHEYALIYGSPVPGYAAPDDTINPATRVARVFLGILADATDARPTLWAPTPLPASLREQLDTILDDTDIDVDHELLTIGIGQWAQLFGIVSFELFGTFRNVLDDADAFFERQVDYALAAMGLDDGGD